MYTKKLTEDELLMASQLMKAHYGKYYCKSSEELSSLISNEFDCNCLPEEVEKYVDYMTNEEEDAVLIYKNIFE